MSRPLLYTYRRCPYAMRARMALLLVHIAFDAVEISLKDKPAQMLAASPKGTVPVLCLPDGQVLEQSWDIVHWALSSSPYADWWTRAQTPVNAAWLALNDGEFKHHLDRYKYLNRLDAAQQAEWQAHREQAVSLMLRPLDAHLAQATFLGGDTACATDIGLFPFVRQFAAVDRTWFDSLPLPHLHAWLSTWLSHPLFEACMHKLPAQEQHTYPGLLQTAPSA
jgi:glutathione S-transferase